MQRPCDSRAMPRRPIAPSSWLAVRDRVRAHILVIGFAPEKAARAVCATAPADGRCVTFPASSYVTACRLHGAGGAQPVARTTFPWRFVSFAVFFAIQCRGQRARCWFASETSLSPTGRPPESIGKALGEQLRMPHFVRCFLSRRRTCSGGSVVPCKTAAPAWHA